MKYIKLLLFFLLIGVAVSGHSSNEAAKGDTDADIRASIRAYWDALSNNDPQAMIQLAENVYAMAKDKQHEENAAFRVEAAYILGDAHLRARNRDQAKEILGEALKLAEQTVGQEDEQLIRILIPYGGAHLRPRKRVEFEHFDRAIDIGRKHYGKNSVELARVLLRIGGIIESLSGSYEGARYTTQSRKAFEHEGEVDTFDYATSLFYEGRFDLFKGKRRTGLTHLTKALDIFSRLEDGQMMERSVRRTLFEAYIQSKETDLATEQVLKLSEISPAVSSDRMLPIYRGVPSYPRSAAKRGEGGWVDIVLEVDKFGFTKNIKIEHIEGDRAFGKAAVSAVKEYRYIPRFENGEIVHTTGVKIRVVFKMQR